MSPPFSCSVTASTVACGTFRADTAWAAFCLHVVYLEPQIAKLLGASGNDTFPYLCAVAIPSLVLKPAIALFVTQLALREVVHRESTILESLPDACLSVKGGIITFANRRARQLLCLGDTERRPLEKLFDSAKILTDFQERLRKEGHVFGFDAEIVVSGHSSNHQPRIWARLDGFRASTDPEQPADEDIVMLILDRHDMELANAVQSLTHDYVQPRLRELAMRLGIGHDAESPVFSGSREQALCRELLKVMGLLRQEFPAYWRLVDGRDLEAADVRQCLEVAWLAVAAMKTTHAHHVHHRLSFEAPANTRVALDDPALTRAFVNIFTNAVTAASAGSSPPEARVIASTVTADPHWVQIAVENTGVQFPQTIVDFMNNRRRPASAAIGLGLMSLRWSAARAGGRVVVGNRSDKQGLGADDIACHQAR